MTGPEFEDVTVCRFDELDDPGSKEFRVGDGDWPYRGFVVRQGDDVCAYQNYCVHAGHPLNWKPDSFLTPDGDQIICSSHGAVYEIKSGVCVAGPCPGKKLRALTVEIRDGSVVVRVPMKL